jgi:hypothetical protein
MNFKLIFALLSLLVLGACATFGPKPKPGDRTIQENCHSVIGYPNEFVCEQPGNP